MFFSFLVGEIPFAGIELKSQRVRGLRGTSELPGRPAVCVVCVFFPCILDIKFVGRTSRGHRGGRSHRISHPPFCGAFLNFSREKDSAIPFPRRPCVCVCFLPIHSGHQVRWTYQPGSHRRKVTQDFSSTFFLRCVPSFFSREGFSLSFPSSTVKSNFVFSQFLFAQKFCYTKFRYTVVCVRLEKNLNSERPPVRGKNVKTFVLSSHLF